MIIIKSMAGLANRMFQYALYKSFIEKGFIAYIDDSYKPKLKHENIDIKTIFPTVDYKRPIKWDVIRLLGHDDLFSKFLKRLPISKKLIYRTNASEGFISNIFSCMTDLYLVGVFQSERYFDNVKERIRCDFTFSEFTDFKNIQIAEEMIDCDSVAIHIRKGTDYLAHDVVNNTCSLDYYKEAIELVLHKIPNAKFYVFSDNFDWVNDNLNFVEYAKIDWNPTSGWGNHFDMQLMSICKHNIIANSTYSWWGAWLNNNPNKIVIGPMYWFNPKRLEFYKKDLEIMPNDWIKI